MLGHCYVCISCKSMLLYLSMVGNICYLCWDQLCISWVMLLSVMMHCLELMLCCGMHSTLGNWCVPLLGVVLLMQRAVPCIYVYACCKCKCNAQKCINK
mgnify:CR=1 FL=1